MRIFRFCFGTVLFLFLGMALSGQTYRLFQEEMNEIITNAKWRLGPLRFRPLFHLYNVGYDNNVYYEPGTGQPVSDYTALISPELRTYLVVGHSLIVSLIENPEYLYYHKEKEMRSFTNSYSPGVRLLLLNRFVLSADYHRQKHRRRAFSEFERQITDTTEGFNAGLFIETARGTSFGFSGTSDQTRFEDVVLPDYVVLFSRILDRTENTGNIELYYKIFSGSTFFAKAGFTKYEFKHPETQWRNSHSYQAVTGVRLPIAGRATGVLSLGYKKFIPEEEGRRGFSGLVADTSLYYRSGRWSWRLGYRRDNRFSYWEEAYIYIDDLVSAGWSFSITRWLKFDYSYATSRLTYPEPFGISVPDSGFEYFSRKDRIKTHSPGVIIRILRNTGLGISYNITERSSSVPGFSYKRNFFGAFLTQGF